MVVDRADLRTEYIPMIIFYALKNGLGFHHMVATAILPFLGVSVDAPAFFQLLGNTMRKQSGLQLVWLFLRNMLQLEEESLYFLCMIPAHMWHCYYYYIQGLSPPHILKTKTTIGDPVGKEQRLDDEKFLPTFLFNFPQCHKCYFCFSQGKDFSPLITFHSRNETAESPSPFA